MGSLCGICGRVLRVADETCLDTGRDDDDDDVSPPLDLDMLTPTLQQNNEISQQTMQ